MSARLVVHEYGDAALLVDVEAADYPTRWAAARSLGDALRTSGTPGLIDVVASYQNVVVSFEPLLIDSDELRTLIDGLATGAADRPKSHRPTRHLVIPVVYGGSYGPDLDAVADELSTTPDAVVDHHLSGDWVVRFVGSPVGAPMMDGPRLPASVPRRAAPRARVEPGSVALSGLQSMIYNAPSPGGWQLIGRTPLRLFDLARPPHVPYRAGDTIRFRRIGADEWDRWARPASTPAPRL